MTTPPPPWIDDLVIYELNPRGFTSPRGAGDGSGSGTFASLAARLPYLRDLGINAVWLAGFCEATDHFYGIWSVYAAKRPDRLDPTLGGAAELKALVDSAHAHGIRVFLDVVSHGVVRDSPLVADHPEWFDGGSWGMRDYDYTDTGFREWWVRTWTGYVRDAGVDGFRVDMDLRDRTLWDEITGVAARAGRPIVVFGEGERYHFQQLSHHFEHGHQSNLVPGDGNEHLPVETIAPRSYSNDLVGHVENGADRYSSVEVSCHDAGWKCPPGNYYVIRGSRFRLGYGALLAPQIPIFFAGEEFDADQIGLPKLRRGLYGDGGPGGWLYGNRLEWRALDDPRRAAMLADARTLLRIRRENRDLLNGDGHACGLTRVGAEPAGGPVPYARYIPGDKAIVIVGNDREEDVRVRLSLPLREMQLDGYRRYAVTELMTGRTTTWDEDRMSSYEITVPADGASGGGVRVLKVEPAGSRAERRA